MNDERDTLTPKQEQGMLALLRGATIEDAAKAVGVSTVTLWRWNRQPDFQARLRQARRELVQGALGEFQHLTVAAVQALERNLTSGDPSVEVRAALGVLDRAIKATDVLDHEERVARLERQVEQLDEDQRFEARLARRRQEDDS